MSFRNGSYLDQRIFLEDAHVFQEFLRLWLTVLRKINMPSGNYRTEFWKQAFSQGKLLIQYLWLCNQFFFSTCVICYKSHLAINRNYRSVPADTLEKYIGLLLDLILTKIVDSCVAWTRFIQRWSISQLLPQITINGRSWPDYKKVKTPRLSLIVAFKTGHLVLFLMRVT